MLRSKDVHFVPWTNISEWKDVREKILSGDIGDVNRAYEIILMWKLKYPNIPAYIECTCCILQVMLQEYDLCNNKHGNLLLVHEHDLRLSYSTALIRFVNHVSSVSNFKGDSLFEAARMQNIPDWVINMRHDAAHGQELPALEALHLAAELSLKWLLDNYWVNEESYMTEFEPASWNRVSQNEEDKYEMKPAVNLAFSLLESCISSQNRFLKYFVDFPMEVFENTEKLYMAWKTNEFLQQKGTPDHFEKLNKNVTKYRDFHFNSGEKNKRGIKIKNLKELMISVIEQIAPKRSRPSEWLVDVLVESEFMSGEPNVDSWEDVLQMVHRIGGLSKLLTLLFDSASLGNKTAAFWLGVLAPSLQSLKKKWTIFQQLKNRKGSPVSDRILKLRASAMDTDSYAGLIFHLEMCKPPVIKLEMMKPVLMNPDGCSQKVVQQYLGLIQPPLPNSTLDVMKNLMDIYNGDFSSENSHSETIYTIADLVTDREDPVVEAAPANNSWTKSTIGCDAWSKCTIGLLPFQTVAQLELPNHIKWKVRSTNRKRTAMPLISHTINMKKRKT